MKYTSIYMYTVLMGEMSAKLVHVRRIVTCVKVVEKERVNAVFKSTGVDLNQCKYIGGGVLSPLSIRILIDRHRARV